MGAASAASAISGGFGSTLETSIPGVTMSIRSINAGMPESVKSTLARPIFDQEKMKKLKDEEPKAELPFGHDPWAT